MNVSVPWSLKQRLRTEARRQRRNLSSLVRVLLEESLLLEEALAPTEQNEYEVVLTHKQASLLTKRGYQLILASAEQLALPGL